MARTAIASIVARLSVLFSHQARREGYSIAAAGKVRIREGSDTRVSARVFNDGRHDVYLTRDGEKLQASCTCSNGNRSHPCKHIWATIIQADNAQYLRGPLKNLPTRVEFLESASDDEAEVEDDYYDEWEEDEDEWEEDGGEPEKKQESPSRNRPAPPEPAWRKEFANIRARVAQVEASRGNSRSQPWPPDRQILYIVDLPTSVRSDGLVLEVNTRERKMNGDWAKPKTLRVSLTEIDRIPDPIDRQILCTLLGASSNMYYRRYQYYNNSTTRFVLPGTIACTVLETVCRTGRCMMRPPQAPEELRPIVWDTEAPWELVVRMARDDSEENYVLSAFVQRGEKRLPLRRPFLFLSDRLLFAEDRVSQLEHFGATGWFDFLAADGRIVIPIADASAFVSELLALPRIPKIEMPEELRFEDVAVAPRPFLRVRSPRNGRGRSGNLLCQLSFQYGELVIPNDDARPILVEPEKRVMMRRDDRAELAAYHELIRLGFKPASYWTAEEGSLELAHKHLARVVSELLAAGWHVEAEGKPYRHPGEIRIDVKSGIDWFELHGSVSYGETETSLPKLLAALKKGQNIVELGDGTIGMVPEEWLKKYGVLAGLGSAQEDHLRFSRSQAGLLDALLLSQPEATCDDVFSQVRDELKQFGGVRAADEPPEFVGELRAYQREGLGWMEFLQRFGFGGCLADDMGLGKTVQVLALLESRRAIRAQLADQSLDHDDPTLTAPEPTPGSTGGSSTSDSLTERAGSGVARPGPSLVVVPKSLVFNWKQEAARFTPNLRVLDHTGTDRTRGTEHFDDYDVVLTTYGTLRRDALDFKDARFDYVILDEAQAIKNSDTDSAKAARLLHGNHRLALSGTPVENHLGELWSLFEFLNPGMLGAASVLKLGGAGARNPAPETRELLARALRPFILRRTKVQVAKDLPEKTEQTIYCELEENQRKLYNELRDHYRRSLLDRVARDGINKSKFQILEALLRLRQAACHPGLIDQARTGDTSAKLDVLIPQLVEVLDEDHKVLVFSQFTSMLAIVRDRLDAEKIRYEYLDGKTRNRGESVHRFQSDPDCKLFLISLKAGGLGLNLTAAEYVFLLDPWWNPAVEAQAIDRTHRIGQTRNVFAYRLIARDTVEEKVLALQETKRDLADAIINADNSLLRNIAREDLELLLS